MRRSSVRFRPAALDLHGAPGALDVRRHTGPWSVWSGTFAPDAPAPLRAGWTSRGVVRPREVGVMNVVRGGRGLVAAGLAVGLAVAGLGTSAAAQRTPVEPATMARGA